MRHVSLRGPRTPKALSQNPDFIVADAVAAAFRRHGIDTVFGQSIPSALMLACEDIGIRQVVYRTENAGAAMADGYARVSGRIGVVAAQNGPAATLLVPGLAEALKSSIPLLAIVQDVPRSTVDRNAFQELDHVALFGGCAKWIRRLTDPKRIDDYIDMAIMVATSGRPGPVVLLLPLDFLAERVEPSPLRKSVLGHYPLDRVRPEDRLIEEAAGLLAQAEHPLVVSGGGVHLSQAHDALAALQDLAALPVGTTVMGKGSVDEMHALSLGVIGNIMGHRSASRYCKPVIDRADVVLLVGTRTAQNGTESWRLFAKDTRFIHIDIDGGEIGRNYEGLRLAGDARLTLAALTAALHKQDLSKRQQQRPGLEAEIAKARVQHHDEAREVLQSDASPLRPERVMAEVAKVLAPDMIAVADASYSSVWLANYLRALKPGMRFLTPRGLAGLGWGLPLAMGARCARPDATVLCFAGDGGFGHVWSELETSVREQIKVVITIFNNQILGFQKDGEDERHGRHTDAIYFSPVDHAAVARAAGCTGIRVNTAVEYAAALQQALSSPGPTLIDVVTDPEAYPPLTVFDVKIEQVRQTRRKSQA